MDRKRRYIKFNETFIKNYDENSDKANKRIYLGQAILDNSKTFMYEFWYDYIKPKYGNKARLCYTDTDSFVIYVKTDGFYKDISNDVDNWFDTSNLKKK